ncbi:MAG: hypothetical protein E3K37_09250 [Candidatus Kuenenia sp.]|nr:hypothetical protein [Candidatus Kuenenia hertensis]
MKNLNTVLSGVETHCNASLLSNPNAVSGGRRKLLPPLQIQLRNTQKAQKEKKMPFIFLFTMVSWQSFVFCAEECRIASKEIITKIPLIFHSSGA